MKVTQAVLPLAGLGTRFLPWTKVVPKELLPLGSQPIIAHLVDECLENGIEDICFVISRGKEMIPQYFFEHPELEQELAARGKEHLLHELRRYDNVRFHTVYQEEQKGDGHAILQAADWVDSDTIVVLFGDDLFVNADTALAQLLRAHEQAGDAGAAVLALENIDREQTKRYGIVEVEQENAENPRLKKIAGLVEKPEPADAPSTLGIVGRYLIPRSTFEILPTVAAGNGGEIRLIDALTAQLSDIAVYGYECEGTRLDTGTPEGYKHAVQVLG